MATHIPPQFLYRYRPTDTKYFADEIMKAIHDQKIFLSNVSNVNDPFEALPFVYKNTINEVRQYLAKFEGLFGKGIAITGTNYGLIAERNGFLRSHVRKFSGPSLESAKNTILFLENAVEHLRRQIKVACLSERWDSLLMWGHYGQSHKGICIEYAPKIGIAAKERVAPLAIDYCEVRPTVSYIEIMEHTALARNENISNFFDEDRAQRTFNAIAMTKPKDWEYEHEWRIMDVGDSAAGYSYIPSLEPTSILLGAHHSPDTLQTVREAVAGRIDIEIVSLDERRFGLKRKLLLRKQ